jgi:cytochrome c oxidase subunit 2
LLRAIQAARRMTWRSGSMVVLAMLALILAACGGTRTNDNPTSDAAAPGIMPGEVVTTQGIESAGLYLPIFLVAVVVFILVEGIVLLVTLRFRRKASDKELPPQTHGNNLLEVVWTAIPFVVVLIMFVGSFAVLTRVEAKTENPGVVVDATGFQWQWTFEYRDHGLSYTGVGKQGPEMVVPINEPVRIRLHATDVIHAFYVPQFFYKKDAIPGRTNEFEVVVEKPGTYGGQCAEFCGLAHGDMFFTVRAVERTEYDAWLEAEIAAANATPTPPPSPVPGESQAPVGEAIKVLTTQAAPLAFDVATIEATAGSTITV